MPLQLFDVQRRKQELRVPPLYLSGILEELVPLRLELLAGEYVLVPCFPLLGQQRHALTYFIKRRLHRVDGCANFQPGVVRDLCAPGNR